MIGQNFLSSDFALGRRFLPHYMVSRRRTPVRVLRPMSVIPLARPRKDSPAHEAQYPTPHPLHLTSLATRPSDPSPPTASIVNFEHPTTGHRALEAQLLGPAEILGSEQG